MSFYKIVNGAIPSGDQWMANMLESLSLGGLNLIRMLQDRSVSFSADGSDWFAEAYVDADGRLDTVDTSLTTAVFDTYSYKQGSVIDESSNDTTSDPDSFNNPSNAFDNDNNTNADKSLYNNGAPATTASLGKTFSQKTVKFVYINIEMEVTALGSGAENNMKAILQTYDGSSWNDESTLIDDTGSTLRTVTYKEIYELNKSVEGIRIYFSNVRTDNDYSEVDAKIYSLEYGELGYSLIYHNIPSGRLPSTISSSYAKIMYDDYEDGVSVQYKFTNASEDSGWLNEDEISSFTAFTSEPTQLIVKLIPKDNNPTAGYPSIKGITVRGG